MFKSKQLQQPFCKRKTSLIRIRMLLLVLIFITSFFAFRQELFSNNPPSITLEKDSLDEVEARLKLKLAKDQKNTTLLFELGDTLRKQAFYLEQDKRVRKLSESEQVARKCLDSEPNSHNAWHLLGYVQLKIAKELSKNLNESKYLEAESSLRTSLKIERKNADALCDLGCVLFDQNLRGFKSQSDNKLAEASKILRESRELNPQNKSTLFHLGCVLENLSKIESGKERIDTLAEAEEVLAAALKMDSQNCSIMCFYAEVLRKLGTLLLDKGGVSKLNTAERIIKKIISVNPQLEEGMWFSRLGMVNFAQAIKLSGKAKTDKINKAKIALRSALEINPKNTSALNLLSRLEAQ